MKALQQPSSLRGRVLIHCIVQGSRFDDLKLGVGPKPSLSVIGLGPPVPLLVADSDERSREKFWPKYKVMRDRIGHERGWPEMERREFDQEVEFGSLYVGSPKTVATKIIGTLKALGASRFDHKYSAGPLAHET